MQRKPLVVIVGPTASGKSDLAMEIAQEYDGEIICADSRTVYRGMDIGTAKPTLTDRQAVKHHLLDLVNPDQIFTAADFKRLAHQAIDDILTRGKLPILVGGSGLYIDSVLFDYQFGPPADAKRRAYLQTLTTPELVELCRDNSIPLPHNDQNPRHLVRAIELGGLVSQEKVIRTDTIVVGITIDRTVLRARVAKRAWAMVQQGVLHEVAELGRTYGWEVEPLRGNIYRALRPVVEESVPLESALEEFVTSDMRLAKRQMTWFKRNPHIIWGEPTVLKQAITHFIQQNNLS